MLNDEALTCCCILFQGQQKIGNRHFAAPLVLCLVLLGLVSTLIETSNALTMENRARIEVKEPIINAKIQNASDLMRSMQASETMDATVQETARTHAPMIDSWTSRKKDACIL